MRNQAALWKTGRSSRVDNEVDIFQLQTVAGDRRVAVPGKQVVVASVAWASVLSQHDIVLHGAVPHQQGCVLPVNFFVEKDLRLFARHELAQFLHRKAGVIGHQNGSQLPGRVIGVQQLHPVPGKEGHPVPLGNAKLFLQAVSQAVGPLIQITVCILFTRIHIDDRHAAGVQAGSEIRIVSNPSVRHTIYAPLCWFKAEIVPTIRRARPFMISTPSLSSAASAAPPLPATPTFQ
ncbi:hypothetical protein SDC9_56416 [bioreactor metagenome]|uniref:Uncharacterized protein n=1 Tax=bioreactor metagenome TaxID=1076179 RepID=A0A644X1R8_9ZZZZ